MAGGRAKVGAARGQGRGQLLRWIEPRSAGTRAEDQVGGGGGYGGACRSRWADGGCLAVAVGGSEADGRGGQRREGGGR